MCSSDLDLWGGANFKLKIRKVEGYQNYDKSEFESSSTLGNFSDDELERIWKSEHSIQQFLSDKEFKSYDDLKVRLNRVLGLAGDVKPKTTVETIREQVKSAPVVSEDSPWSDTTTVEDDDDLAYFSKLAEED